MFNMKVLTAIAALATTVVGRSLQSSLTCPSSDIDLQNLGSSLSSSAKVYCPGSSGFKNVTTRWSVLEEPKVNVVVVPGTENDVAETVSFDLHPSFPEI